MILLYLALLAGACAAFAILWFLAPGLSVLVKVLICAGIFLLLAASATLWINWAAQRMPDDARVIVPVEKKH